MGGERISIWLRKRIERREWTQATAARKFGVSAGTLSDWLSGNKIPNTESCDRIADALGADPDTVLTLAGHRHPDPTYAKDDPRNDIISQLPKLTDDQALVLLDMIESMQKRLSRILASQEIVHGRP